MAVSNAISTRTQDTAAHAQNLISAAYQLPADSRTGWLRMQVSGNEALRREVSWMLEALRAPDDEFLEGRPRVDALAAVPTELSVPAPRDYRILQPLGEGGMGTVYLAERTDGDYRQQVALKFLNAFALVNPVVVARFVDERRILAQLNHPNIAHLVDGGTLGDGRPFLAMEYVDGVRIDHHCDAQRLGQRERLALFVKVCAGVQFAHQRLVIHRDIKPANILVGDDGEPKLLDFGIARLVDAEGEQTRTEAGLRMMTLAYASPEQIAGDALATATDIYSLGILLYELLCGARPWRDDVAAAELARQICETEATPPSVVARRSGTHRAIDRDLDAIVLKALRKEPAQRYGSVRELCDDIGNYLESRPVLARRGHRVYRLRKFAFRHRYALATLVFALMLVLAFAADRQVQLDHTRAERARADSERVKAEQVSRVLADVFASADMESARTREPTVREALVAGAGKIRAQLRGQPEVQATVLIAIANTLQALGRRDEALPMVDEIVQLLDEAVPAQRLLKASALVLRARIHRALGDPERALTDVENACALAGAPTATSGMVVAAAQRERGGVLSDRLAPVADIRAAFDASVAALEIADAPPEQKGKTLSAMARGLREKTLYEEALGYDERAVALTATLPDDHPVRLGALIGKGYSLLQSGRVIEAEKLLHDVLPTQGALVERSGDPVFARNTLMSLGALQYMLAQYGKAAQTFEQALALTSTSGDATVRVRVLYNLTVSLKESDQLARARTTADEMITLAGAAFGHDSPYYLKALAERGNVAMLRGAADAAVADLTAVVAGLRPLAHDAPEDLNVARAMLAHAYAAQQRTDDAVALMRVVLAARTAQNGDSSPLVAQTRISLAEILLAHNDKDNAVAELERAHATLLQGGEQCSPNAAEARAMLERAAPQRRLPALDCPSPR